MFVGKFQQIVSSATFYIPGSWILSHFTYSSIQPGLLLYSIKKGNPSVEIFPAIVNLCCGIKNKLLQFSYRKKRDNK